MPKWFSHRYKRLLEVVRFQAGTGATYMVLADNEEVHWNRYQVKYTNMILGYLENDYLFEYSEDVDDGNRLLDAWDSKEGSETFGHYIGTRPPVEYKDYHIERVDNPHPSRLLITFLRGAKLQRILC